MLTYPGTITLSERTLTFLADVLQAHREQVHTWRKLPARDQALLVLAYLRNGDTYARLAAGFGVGLATVYRYVREAVALLAAAGRSLTAALGVLACTHSNFAVVDGTLVRTHRVRAPRPALLLRPAPPPRRQPAGADRPAGPADLDL